MSVVTVIIVGYTRWVGVNVVVVRCGSHGWWVRWLR